ncbi:MAG TPA: hypothetical protein VFK88_09835 [Gallionella sp.]|nr:hypothetical protein [Gallionella sp.]
MTIPLGIQGKVINSHHAEHFVKVSHDEASGGFYIREWWRESNGPNQNGAFDSWVKSKEDLAQFFAESGWIMQWYIRTLLIRH